MKTALTRSRGARAHHRGVLGTAVAALTVAGMAVLASPAAAAPAPISQASALAVNLDLPTSGLNLQSSVPPTTSQNDGADPNSPNSITPMVSMLAGQSLLTAGALAEVTEANTDGSSFACAGIFSPGGNLALGSGGTTCTATGSGTGGISLNLNELANVHSFLDGVSQVSITAGSMIAHAYASGGTAHGTATIVDPTVSVNVAGGIGSFTVPLVLNGDPNEDIWPAIIDALTGLGDTRLSATIDGLKFISDLTPLTANLQSSMPDGSLRVSALHIEQTGAGGGQADLAEVSVGPNTIPAPPTPMSLAISPTAPAVIAGTAQNVTVQVLDSAGDTMTGVTGLSLSSSAAGDRITDNGGGSFSVVGTAAGTRTLTAKLGTLTATSSLTVKPDAAHPAAITLALSKTTIEIGDSIVATVGGADAYGNDLGDLTGQSTLTSDHPTDVISGDTIRFVHASTHVITATMPVAGGANLTATASVTVTPTPAASVTITPTPAGSVAVTPTATQTGLLAKTGSNWGFGIGFALLLVLIGAILTAAALWYRRPRRA